MRFSATGRVGLAMIAAGILLYGGMKYWIATRNFTPVDVPISLHQGEVLRKDFAINTAGRYWAYILTDAQSWTQEDAEEAVQAHFRWEIRDQTGREIENYSWGAEPDGSVTGMQLGFLDLDRGKYRIEVHVLRNLPWHSKYHPRLAISTDDSDARFAYLLVRWISVFVVLTGVALLAMQLSTAISHPLAEERFFAGPPTGSYQSHTIKRRLRECPRLSMPHWSLYAALVFFSVLTPVWVLTADRLPALGIFVNLLPLNAEATTDAPKIIVRVITDGGESKYLVNGMPVRSKDLAVALRTEVARQQRWIVYIDGDPNCLHADIMAAVDAAVGAHAKAILLTPATRSLVEGTR